MVVHGSRALGVANLEKGYWVPEGGVLTWITNVGVWLAGEGGGG